MAALRVVGDDLQAVDLAGAGEGLGRGEEAAGLHVVGARQGVGGFGSVDGEDFGGGAGRREWDGRYPPLAGFPVGDPPSQEGDTQGR